MIRGVIFDMDGTLTVPHIDFQALRRELGIMAGDIVDYLKAADDHERQRVEAVLHRFEEDAAANAELQTGARDLLDALRVRGIKLGLLTRNSRKSVATVLEKFGLAFDATLTRDDAAHKPSPEPVLRLAREWGLAPAELLMVGDYIHDIRSGRSAGSKTALLVNDRAPEWAGEADFTIHRLDELPKIIEDIP
ncbi:MAG: HAD family hydrolase [Chloroflexi bacterium]|nr:HAD family hydrolase [Chloroflexota bacterium]